MPTPSPALKRLPRWRTMISPPLTRWPAKVFTPSRCAAESRPLRLEPSPFLCAIAVLLRCRPARRAGARRLCLPFSGGGGAARARGLCGGGRLGRRARGRARGARPDLGDLEARQLLAVTGAALVAALGLELEDAQLRPALVTDDLRLDLDLGEAGRVEDRLL